jgi:hypothetical protein
MKRAGRSKSKVVIVGPPKRNLTISVQISPDSNRARQPEIAVKDGKFSGTAYFDSTKAEGRVKDNCSRFPETVDVVLSREGQKVDQTQLNISKDYVRDKNGDVKLRSSITLHSQP